MPCGLPHLLCSMYLRECDVKCKNLVTSIKMRSLGLLGKQSYWLMVPLNAGAHYIVCPRHTRLTPSNSAALDAGQSQSSTPFPSKSPMTVQINTCNPKNRFYPRALELTLLACANKNLQQVNVSLHAFVHPSSCAIPSLILRSAILSFSIA